MRWLGSRFAPSAADRLSAGLALAALLVAACGPEGTRPPAQTWIERAPAAFLTADDLRDVDCGERFALDSGVLPAGLELERGARLDGVGGGTSVRGGNSAPRLRVVAPLAAGTFDAVRLVMSGPRRGKVRLEGTPESGDPWRLELDKTDGTGALRDHFLFRLPAELAARGPVTLVLEPTTAAGEIVSLREFCIGHERVDAGRVAAAASLPWKVTLDDEARDALLVASGRPLARSFEIFAGARLGFTIGGLEVGDDVDLVLRARRGGETASREVWRRALSAPEARGRWQDAEVDLSALGGGTAELGFAVESRRESPPTTVLAIAHPRLYGPRGKTTRPNIVLISLDTLRADHLSLYGYSRATSPGIDAWARQGATVFRRVVAPSGWTLPSHFSLFTGLEAFRHPANYNSIAIDESAYPTLAERLWQAGYRTHAITAGGFVHPDYGLARGFESFRFWPAKSTRADELATHAREFGEFLEREAERPFLLFFHTYEIHAPNPLRPPFLPDPSRFPAGAAIDSSVNPPTPEEGFLGTHHLDMVTAAGARRPLARDEYDLAVDAYDSAIAYTDAELAPLLRTLGGARFGRDTVVAIVADHGESLGENDHGGHGSLQADNLFVPMIVRLPASSVASAVTSQVRLIDLFPTLLELAGVAVPAGIDGESLRAPLGGAAIASRPAWSYAAATNFGLALVRQSGLKMEWRNSPWRALAGGVRWLHLDGVDETVAAPPSGDDAARLPELAVRAYSGGMPGLWISVTNRGSSPVRVTLLSDLVDPVSLKTPDLGAPSLDWSDIGRLSAEVSPQRPLRLVAERLLRREVAMQVSVSAAGCAASSSQAITADAGTLDRPRTWQIPIAGCGGDSSPRIEVRLEWRGPLPERRLSADSDLADDLRALGYLQ